MLNDDNSYRLFKTLENTITLLYQLICLNTSIADGVSKTRLDQFVKLFDSGFFSRLCTAQQTDTYTVTLYGERF